MARRHMLHPDLEIGTIPSFGGVNNNDEEPKKRKYTLADQMQIALQAHGNIFDANNALNALQGTSFQK